MMLNAGNNNVGTGVGSHSIQTAKDEETAVKRSVPQNHLAVTPERK